MWVLSKYGFHKLCTMAERMAIGNYEKGSRIVWCSGDGTTQKMPRSPIPPLIAAGVGTSFVLNVRTALTYSCSEVERPELPFAE